MLLRKKAPIMACDQAAFGVNSLNDFMRSLIIRVYLRVVLFECSYILMNTMNEWQIEISTCKAGLRAWLYFLHFHFEHLCSPTYAFLLISYRLAQPYTEQTIASRKTDQGFVDDRLLQSSFDSVTWALKTNLS